MAEPLEHYEFKRPGRKAKYPWAQWANGSIWQLRRGEDYICTVGNLEGLFHREAKKRGLKFHRDIIDRGSELERIVVQFYGHTDKPGEMKLVSPADAVASSRQGRQNGHHPEPVRLGPNPYGG